MGGTPRRGLLFEGLPGTGKTHTAKAMAREAGVPFLFVSATSFQSMYYGATARKIRSYFKALRKAARTRGRRHRLHRGDRRDRDAARRHGRRARRSAVAARSTRRSRRAAHVPSPNAACVSEGTGGVVNELLVQMQSFDEPTGSREARQLVHRAAQPAAARHTVSCGSASRVDEPILLIAATNRADNLDPALLRPGRFDRRLTFATPGAGRPARAGRPLPGPQGPRPELDDAGARDRLAAVTQGYTPVMIEHLLDEALVNALRRGVAAMTYADIEQARLTEEIGIGQPVRYTEHEQRLIATHEAGHADMAWLVAPNRRLEVLTIIKRGDALGLLAHGDRDEVFTRSRAEMLALIQIAMGGRVAEELFFGDVSTGPGGDLPPPRGPPRRWSGAAGMTGSLISFAATPHDLVAAVLGDAQARAQLEAVLDDARTTVRRLLSRHRHLVEALRDALLERHELIGEEITDVLEAATLAQEQLMAREESDRTAATRGRELRLPRARRRSGCAWPSLRGVPEGHTVHRIARQLTQDLVGRRLAVSSPQGRFAAGAARLDGQVLVACDAVGKQLFCTFESGDVLRVHLGLYGAWDFYGSLTPLVPGGYAAGSMGAPRLRRAVRMGEGEQEAARVGL